MAYTPHTAADIEAMLAAIGVRSLDELLTVPDAIALRKPLALPAALPEVQLTRKMGALAVANAAVEYTSFLGAGAYRHYVPPAVMALAMRGEFLTAYTPYQAEVSQGYLQAIYEWQTYVALLTGLDVANASVYDGATALAEGVIMAVNATGRTSIAVSRAVHPNYRAVLQTYARGLDLHVEYLPVAPEGTTDMRAIEEKLAERPFAAVVVQSPNFFGSLDAPSEEARAAIERSGALLIGVVAEALSLAALQPPAAWGAQIAVGEGQSFGNPVAYGGPYVGFMATTKEHLRRIPGRLVGRSVDKNGRPAYVLTLQAREQHIRREKATSNICTNQAHCALVATIYLAMLGARGLRECAILNLARTHELAERVTLVEGYSRAFSAPVFNEVTIRVPRGLRARAVLEALQEQGILGGVDLGRWYPELRDCIVMNATELTTQEEIERLCTALEGIQPPARSVKSVAARV
ncbi:MAG TPA: aminomethyl-transferring glycine dehydrogenase subunit GcvPA [Candidatus Acidoferrales bacterium]|nr:aminomethyl-transferring glycine dehydrogenase subunit GcvPA [Candidatus Acidoferrales bacterium]